MTDVSGSTFTISKRLWTLGNFSRFVRPGFVRIEAESSPHNGPLVSAFKGPGGTRAVVAINSDESPREIRVRFQNAPHIAKLGLWVTSAQYDLKRLDDLAVKDDQFTTTLPPQSVTTFADVHG